MKWIELALLIEMFVLGIYTSITDIRHGIVRNKLLAIAAGVGLALDFLYYGIMANDLLLIFLSNMGVLIAFAVLLYVTHCWAGGDCKLLIVLGLLYPAGFYISYNGSAVTLFLPILFSFITGYLFLLFDSFISFVQQKNIPDCHEMPKQLRSFLFQYFTVLTYVAALNLLYVCVIEKQVAIDAVILTAIYICVAFLIGMFPVFKNKILLSAVLAFDIVLAAVTGLIPIGTNIFDYLFIFMTVVLRLVVSKYNYRTIQTSRIKAGMILSTAASVQLLQSKVKGLPPISTEDLKSRLTEEEAESVHRWEHTKYGQPTITIVRKIPFVIFLVIGFVAYFTLWGVL